MKYISIFSIFLCLLATSQKLYAQLSIRNEHDRPIQVAVAYLSSDDDKKWISEGWFSIEVGSVGLLKEKVAVRYYYLYIVDNANHEWGGEGFELMVDEVNKFTIKKADKIYASEENKAYKTHNFMEIDTGGTVKEFTYIFRGKNEPEVSKEDKD